MLIFLTGVMSVYIDGCLFEAVGSTENPNTHDPRITVIGKSATHNNFYAGIMLDKFMFWEKVFEAGQVMALYVMDNY